jgi:dual specificity MAP kinase phosphatase
MTDFLMLGSCFVAKNYDILKSNGITHILNTAGTFCGAYFPEDFTYRILMLSDSHFEDVSCLFMDICDWIEKAREANGRVFVHCQRGVSRSTTFVICYLMWRNDASYTSVLEEVKAKRSIASPNAGFACQLLDWEKRKQKPYTHPYRLFRVRKTHVV